jgi:hypothetical protein
MTTHQMGISKFINRTIGYSALSNKDIIKMLLEAGYFLVSTTRYHPSTPDEPFESTSLIVPMKEMHIVRQWCVDQFTNKHFVQIYGYFVFTKEEDSVLFKLPWVY